MPRISPTGKRCDCLVTALELQIQADAYAPGRVRAELRRWLDARNWPEDDGEDLVLAVCEAVSNAAEHAYGRRRPVGTRT